MCTSVKFCSVFIYGAENEVIPIKYDQIELENGTEYKIAIFNHHSKRRMDATVTIDGSTIGTFRVEPNSNIKVDCNVVTARRLTFFSDKNLGKLVVVAKMEIDREKEVERQQALFRQWSIKQKQDFEKFKIDNNITMRCRILQSNGLIPDIVGFDEVDQSSVVGAGQERRSYQSYQSSLQTTTPIKTDEEYVLKIDMKEKRADPPVVMVFTGECFR